MPVQKSQDEVQYERYAKFCASVPTKPMPFERWAKRRHYSDHLRHPTLCNTESSGTGTLGYRPSKESFTR